MGYPRVSQQQKWAQQSMPGSRGQRESEPLPHPVRLAQCPLLTEPSTNPTHPCLVGDGGTVRSPFDLIKLLRLSDSGAKTNALQEGAQDQRAARTKDNAHPPPPWEPPGLADDGGRGRLGRGTWNLPSQPGREEAQPSLPFPSLPGKLGRDLICKGGEAGIVACHISNKEYTTKGQRTRGFVRIQRWERFI